MSQQSESAKTLSTGACVVCLLMAFVLLAVTALIAPAQLRAETPAAANANEMLVFDWNKPITKGMSGFAQYKPLSAYPQFPNGNWISPINYVNGTLYFRVRILSIPQNQLKMKLGFCFWQSSPKFGEECTKNYAVPGVPGTERRWNQPFKSMNKINKKPINWALPRWKEGIVVRNGRGPVSAKNNFKWNGENPDHWYPMNVHYTAVLVLSGGEPDWTDYGWPTP